MIAFFQLAKGCPDWDVASVLLEILLIKNIQKPHQAKSSDALLLQTKEIDKKISSATIFINTLINTLALSYYLK